MRRQKTVLIVFSGLPGVGKTSVARALAAQEGLVYLRIDTVEQALRDAESSVGCSGYLVAQALALNNLSLGHSVVADCVNPVLESRSAWQAVATSAVVPLINLHLICSDAVEHRHRLESRQVDIPGLAVPTWQSVLSHEYQPWHPAPLCIDTAGQSMAQSIEAVRTALVQWLR